MTNSSRKCRKNNVSTFNKLSLVLSEETDFNTNERIRHGSSNSSQIGNVCSPAGILERVLRRPSQFGPGRPDQTCSASDYRTQGRTTEFCRSFSIGRGPGHSAGIDKADFGQRKNQGKISARVSPQTSETHRTNTTKACTGSGAGTQTQIV